MKHIISFQMQGGLGNILFSLAAALNLSIKNNLDIYLKYTHLGYLHTDPKFYKQNLFKNYKEILDTNDFFQFREQDFSFNKIILPKNVNIFLNGYFQSEKYFIENKDLILEKLLEDEETFDKIKKKYPEVLNEEITSIHVRRGNYLDLNHIYNNLDIEYYRDAIDSLSAEKIFVFSNDTNYCYNNFTDKKFIIINENTDLEDLYLMSLCKNNIIANSSFSWWGAWLNKNENKKIIAPNHWFKDRNDFITRDLIPISWTKI